MDGTRLRKASVIGCIELIVTVAVMEALKMSPGHLSQTIFLPLKSRTVRAREEPHRHGELMSQSFARGHPIGAPDWFVIQSKLRHEDVGVRVVDGGCDIRSILPKAHEDEDASRAALRHCGQDICLAMNVRARR